MAGKKERQRKLARERYLRQQARRAQRARRWRMAGLITAACAVVAGLVTVSVFAFGGGGKPASAASASPNPKATATASPSASATAAAGPARHCAYTPSAPAARHVGMPPAKPHYKAAYRAKITTNRGTLTVDLLNSKATCTVNSFVYLAAKRYFGNTQCHRLTTANIYVLQCGDPTGTGRGGPGYKFANENLAGAKYTQGTLAMANSGPGTNGSQFFIVYKDTNLPPGYTPFGKVASGLGIIQNVAKAGTDNANGQGDGHPREKVVIKSVTITKT